jgi:hypothetical protein
MRTIISGFSHRGHISGFSMLTAVGASMQGISYLGIQYTIRLSHMSSYDILPSPFPFAHISTRQQHHNLSDLIACTMDFVAATHRPFRRQDNHNEYISTSLSFESLYRLLAPPSDEEGTVDYTVFSVAAMTLCIILCVELFRHRLDVLALGRPFFKTVLESVYRECKYFENGNRQEGVQVRSEKYLSDESCLYFDALTGLFDCILDE